MGDKSVQLRERYGMMETEELLELHARKHSLTDAAIGMLDAELKKRNFNEAMIAEEEVRHQIEKQHREATTSRLAPLSFRLVAFAVDVPGSMVVLTAINFPLFLYTPMKFSDSVGWASLAVLVIYVMFKDGANGQSIGKRLLGIQVLEKHSGEPCSLPRSLIRNMFYSMGIIDWIFALGKEQRRLGDQAAGTCVVRK